MQDRYVRVFWITTIHLLECFQAKHATLEVLVYTNCKTSCVLWFLAINSNNSFHQSETVTCY